MAEASADVVAAAEQLSALAIGQPDQQEQNGEWPPTDVESVAGSADNSCITDISVGSSVAATPERDPAVAAEAEAVTFADASSTGVVYDEAMELHRIQRGSHPERPDRIKKIFAKLKKLGLLSRCRMLPSRAATDGEIETCHTKAHREKMDSLAIDYTEKDLERLGYTYDSIYLNKHTSAAARLSAGCLIELTQAVCEDRVRNGVAVIRPPGHHAEHDKCMGFCIYNNVAIAAKLARQQFGKKRVLIVDWDVHHGNGTQNMFIDDPSVLFFSVHRYDHGSFYPCDAEAAGPGFVGTGSGRGFTVNVGWNASAMGDAE